MATPATVKEFLSEVLDRIAADAGIIAIVATRVYLHVPENPTNPLITGRVSVSTDWSDKSSDGYECTITLTYWNSERGDSKLYDIWELVYNLLHNQTVALVSGQNVKLQFSSFTPQVSGDGLSYFANDTYLALIT